MPVFEMRDALEKAYSYSEKWKKKVRAMSDSQVLAIYSRMVREGKIKS